MATPPPPEDLARDVLLVDGDPAVRAGLSAMLDQAGLQVTAVADLDRARDQLVNRFFAVLLVDLDGPGQQAGLTLVGFARERAPQTAVIVLSSRRTFEALAAAFRAGAFDVVPKTHESLPYLRARIFEALENLRDSRSAARLIAQVSEMHERFLAQMVGLFRQVNELEERLSAREEDAPIAPPAPLDLLVVDVSADFTERLRLDCTREAGFTVRFADSGGEALDQAGRRAPDVLLINEDLPDLPTSMVGKSVRAHSPEVLIALLREPRNATPGHLRLLDAAESSSTSVEFSDPGELTEVMHDLQRTIRQRARERRQLIAFRKQHADFLRQYSELRQKLAEEI
ncbi:MAG TPA: response regulator [Polyangia bacterium]